MYQIEKITVESGKITDRSIVFRNEDIDEIMRYWNSYASGISDVDSAYPDMPAEFSGQNFGKQHFYRILDRDE